METPSFGRYQNLDLTLSREGLVTALKKREGRFFLFGLIPLTKTDTKTAFCKCATGGSCAHCVK